jgi:hypothetical protein
MRDVPQMFKITFHKEVVYRLDVRQMQTGLRHGLFFHRWVHFRDMCSHLNSYWLSHGFTHQYDDLPTLVAYSPNLEQNEK